MSKKTKSIICENCDSEYSVKFAKETVAGLPVWCAFCGEEIEEVEDEDDFEEDERQPGDGEGDQY